jgi:outer membrane lipoprotein-sorting protein
MKTFRKASFFLLAAVLGGSVSTTCCAQTAEEIVSKNIDAIGGKALLSSIKSVVISSEFDYNGIGGTTTTYILNGKGFKNETDVNDTKIIQCITDKGGWTINPFAGQATATALPAEAVKQSQGQLVIGGPLMNYSADGGKIELTGKDTADYKIHLTNGNGEDATYYINMKTYLIDMVEAKVNMGGQQITRVIHFSDYKKTDGGAVMPGTQAFDNPQGGTVTITNKKFEINKDIDPAIFDMPK